MSERHHSLLFLTALRQSVLRTLLASSALLFLPLQLQAADNLHSLFNFQSKMAAQGSPQAMIKLGEMYEEGLGTEQNEQLAKEWYEKARDKGHPDGQAHLDELVKKHDRAAKEMAAREQAARDQAAREQAAREEAAREQAMREQAIREQEELHSATEREEAAKREAARKAMTPEERERARAEAILRAEEAEKLSLQKQLEKEKAESEVLKRARSTSAKKK